MTPAQTDPLPPDHGEARAAGIERKWAAVSIAIVTLLVGMAVFAGIHQATMPQLRMELADPRTLHLTGEFIEGNLGSAIEPDGSVTVRAVAQQYSFTPQCIVVPVGTDVTFRSTSADVMHGFQINGTNVNIMLVPGYVSTISARFTSAGDHHMPCHEFCGLGHEGMWGKVKVIDKETFAKQANSHRRLSCVE